MIGTAAPRYTGGYQHGLDSNHFGETEENAGGRLTSAFDSATGITTTYTYKPDTNYVSEVKTTNGAGTVLADDSHSYRNDGLKTGAIKYTLNADGSSDTVTLTWNYDTLDRLTQEVSVDAGNPGAPVRQ